MFILLSVQTLVTVENADIHLMDRDLMQVVFSLTKAGHQQYVPEIVERMRHERGYVPGVYRNITVYSCSVMKGYRFLECIVF